MRMMKRMSAGLSTGLLALSLSVGTAQAIELRPLPKATISVAAHAPNAINAQDILKGINAARRASGLKKLKLNATLSRVAQAHADDMIRRGYFSHYSPNGAKPIHRVKQAGYNGCTVAENLSYSWKTADQAMDGWMKSSGHRANMLHRPMREVGIGISANNMIVAVFAKPC